MILVCQSVIHGPLNWLIVFEMFTSQFCLGNHPKGWFFVLASPWFLNVSLIVLHFLVTQKSFSLVRHHFMKIFEPFQVVDWNVFCSQNLSKKIFCTLYIDLENLIRSTAFFTLYTLKFIKSSWIVGPVI